MNMYARISTVLDDYLRKLTTLDDPEAIALYLRGRGVQAFCGDVSACALAQDIGSILVENGLPHEFDVDAMLGVDVTSYVRVRVGSGTRSLPPVNRPLPPVARVFTHRFDDGQYPELVSPCDTEGQGRIRCYHEQQQQQQQPA